MYHFLADFCCFFLDDDLWPHHQQRKCGMAQDMLCHTAHEQPLHAASTVRSHGNHLVALLRLFVLFRHVYNCACHICVHHDGCRNDEPGCCQWSEAQPVCNSLHICLSLFFSLL